jgi:hypothetical protein
MDHQHHRPLPACPAPPLPTPVVAAAAERKTAAVVARRPPPTLAEMVTSYALARVFPSAAAIPDSVKARIARVGVIPFVRIVPKIRPLSEALRLPRAAAAPAPHAPPAPAPAVAADAAATSEEEDPVTLATARSAAAVAASAAGGYPTAAATADAAFVGAAREAAAALNGGSIWLAMSVDNRSGELCDCGGRREKAEAIETTAARELFEESVRLFDFRDGAAFQRLSTASPVATNGALAVFFVRVAPPVRFGFPDDLATTFANARETLSDSDGAAFRENSLMYWAPFADVAEVAAVRTRPAPPCGAHFSAVAVRRWLRGTRNELVSLARRGGARSNENSARAAAAAAADDSTTASVASATATTAAVVAVAGTAPTPRAAVPAAAVQHPLLYEALRRVLFPVLAELEALLQESCCCGLSAADFRGP